ncbi:Hypothetical protein FKW44_018526, partial [Caligus rogercresseyi]
ATMGYWGFKPIANCNIRVKTPQMSFCAHIVLGSRQPQQWVLGFQTFANCKNT